jgi:hypothetical protein
MKLHIAILIALLGMVAPAHATVTYSVTLDTAPLIGHPAGPFSIAFQLADGSGTGDGNNAAVIGGFQFGAGGAPTNTPTVFGSAFGTLSSEVSLTDSSNLNFFAQTFTPGNTLTFSVSVTTNADAGGILDEFTFSILDNTLTPIPTMAGAPLDVFLSINLTPKPIIQIYASDVSRTPAGGGGPINIPAPQDISPSTSLLSFGSQAVGTTSQGKTVSLTNVGTTALGITSIGITGTDPGDFAQTNTCPVAPATLAPQANCTITVTFTPLATGTRSAAVTIDDASGGTQAVTLTGKGT